MIYTGFFICCVLLTVVCGAIRMISQGMLLTRKCGKTFLAGCVPFVTNIRVHKQIGVHVYNIVGMVLRIAGVVTLISTVVWQYYQTMVNMTHSFGIMLKYYTPADYTTAWNILMTVGSIYIFVGFALRLLTMRRFSKCFGVSSVLNLIGMFCPSLYYLTLAFSKRCVFLLNKPTSDMTSEEFRMYCILSEGDQP